MRALLGRHGDAAVHARIQQVLSSLVRAELLAALPRGVRPAAGMDLVVTCAVGAFMALLARWVEADTTETPEQMDDVFQRVLTRGVTTILDDRHPTGLPEAEIRTDGSQVSVYAHP
ncbi:TetR-like C-terminal domain-containing protein [Streptosporangium sp. NPDC000396]|uniref:TetR-like C-terminal domain-containing protein n=1 Tax=Streptosporangium sp. NPDC000396 TaxID=3366185 RepID=UPI0036BB1999